MNGEGISETHIISVSKHYKHIRKKKLIEVKYNCGDANETEN